MSRWVPLWDREEPPARQRPYGGHIDDIGPTAKPQRGNNPLDYIAARPLPGTRPEVLEWNGVAWQPFAMLSSRSQADQRLPETDETNTPRVR